MADETWKFNVISSMNNHFLFEILFGNSIICHLVLEDKELISDMTLNMVAPKNTLASLKWKRPLNVLNIKQIYNVHARDNKVVRGPKSEMQQLLKLLENDDYVSRCYIPIFTPKISHHLISSQYIKITHSGWLSFLSLGLPLRDHRAP